MHHIMYWGTKKIILCGTGLGKNCNCAIFGGSSFLLSSSCSINDLFILHVGMIPGTKFV